MGIGGSTDERERDASRCEDLAETRHKVGDGTNGRGKRGDFIEGICRSPLRNAGRGIGILVERG